ncbi:MAG TPA: CbiX/SirB N-terminal domain-containing protein [Candidatus Nitrosopolaris sp.]|nr:CbiX/SirB N-terminal domain-containing protein [Candidatus Nitrosopolaris sp.]
MKKAILIVDRGSREPEVRQELEDICSRVKTSAGYYYANYCFLEVLPPFIEEGIKKCQENGADCITVMPYFLYPGMKLKETVRQSARICKIKKLNLVITKPLSYNSMMTHLVMDRISSLKREKSIRCSDLECDILLIGHGSSDKNAKDAFVHIVNTLTPFYRAVKFCFLELDKPNIEQGLKNMLDDNPKVVILMPYFLHKGAHIKRDVIADVNDALKKYPFENAFMTSHLGVDQKLIDLLIERAREVEEKRFG